MRVHRSCPFATSWPTFLYKSRTVKAYLLPLSPSVIRKDTLGEEEEEEEEEGGEHARKVSSNRYRGSEREPFWAGHVYWSGDNRTQFLASLLWSGFTPSSSPFLPPSSPLPLSPISPGDAAANLIQPRLQGKRLT